MRIYFVSLGCDKNLVDSEVMLGIIKNEGYEITSAEENADVIVVNTCAFIEEAVNESVECILKLAEYKKKGHLSKLIVTGCLPSRYKDEILKELPEVDAIVGSADYERIAEIIKQTQKPGTDGQISVLTGGNKERNDSLNVNRVLNAPNYYAYLKIAEGCDNKCTYCTIPSIRGGYRSANLDGLVHEAKALAEQGVVELILVAQDTALYGTDLYGESMLHVLLRKLSEIEGIERIRVLYCYPEHLTDAVIDEMAANPKICRYLDIPIQHADDGILKLMGRRSTSAGLTSVITKLRKAMPDIVLRTTIIVGFPGEGDAEYSNLEAFISETCFDKLGVFAYSKERGTPAAKLPLQVKSAVKQKRKNALMKLQRQISTEKQKSYIGKTFSVFVDGWLPQEEVYCGRSYMDAPETDGLVFFSGREGLLSGDTVSVKITGSAEYDLTGEILEEGNPEGE